MPATPRVVRFTVSLGRKASVNYSTYDVSMTETCDVPEALTDEQLAKAKHAIANRLARQIDHELKAQWQIDVNA